MTTSTWCPSAACEDCEGWIHYAGNTGGCGDCGRADLKRIRHDRDRIVEALASIFHGIELLQQSFSNRQFTIDGRLVGDIGEIIAAAEFDITLDETSRAKHDGITSDGHKVQIKATFKDSLTFRTVPDYYLGLQLFRDGRHEVVFNGPGHIIADVLKLRKGFGKELISISVSRLKRLSERVADGDRIKRRKEVMRR